MTKEELLPEAELKKLFGEWIDRLSRKECYEVVVEGKELKIPTPIPCISRYISRVYNEIAYADEPKTCKERKRLQKKVDTLAVRVASAMRLNRLFLIPVVHSVYWRWLERTKSEKYITGILHCGYMHDKQNFFFLNSNSIKNHCEFLKMNIRMDQK